MSNILILGGTGFSGTNIAREAVRRGHTVTSISRNAPATPVDGVDYRVGDAVELTRASIAGTDVVIGTLSPRGDTAGKLTEIYGPVIELADAEQARFFVIGGFGSLRTAPGAPRLADGDSIPEAIRPESREVAALLEPLAATPDTFDWLFVSPAAIYGGHLHEQPETRGTYRVGGDVAEQGSSIGGQDFAQAIVDEIETPAHHRQHISLLS